MANQTFHNVISKGMKLESFLKKSLEDDHDRIVYGYDVVLKDNQNLKVFVPFIVNKFEYKILIVCREFFCISNNPPETIDLKINLNDVIEIKAVSLNFYLTPFVLEIHFTTLK